ncbi:MAG TPA: hypothetical protein VLN58_12095 [Verrucomicrobiae bacterium]|nr:hypothetical protein [Verrucomicrobiae bacterium]
MHSKPTIRGLNSEPISDWSVDASSVKFVDGEGLFWLFIVDEFDRKVMGTEVVPKIDDTTIISMLSNVIARHGSRPRGISLYGGVFNWTLKQTNVLSMVGLRRNTFLFASLNRANR